MQKLLLFLIPTIIVGCGVEPTNPGLDPDRILHMAGEEAGQITSPRERLTRQLNIANRETTGGKPANARGTLVLARQTLEQADKKAFNDQERLSGWVSICELSRAAGDKAFANGALDQALATLNALTPEPARCEYVPGIEAEVRILRGDAAAASLLRTAADWAVDLEPQHMRRRAYIAYTEELFRCNDYTGGRGVLRHEADAAWRSDALLAIADQARAEANDHEAMGSRNFLLPTAVLAQAAAPDRTLGPIGSGGATAGADTMPAENASFGKPLDFRSNYYRP